MRFLFIGDVVGRPGRQALDKRLGALRREKKVDAVVVNCENAAGGKGVTAEIADWMFQLGADVLTGGNHIWQYREVEDYLERQPRLIRPANYPRAAGWGSYRLELSGGRSLGVIQVEGRVFMRNLECPFAAVQRELERLGPCTATLVDVHAEATSEKQALGMHYDGRVSAVLGTHTHVQTADERILPMGTAYLTDAGMTGPYESVIGMKADAAVKRFLTQRNSGHHVASGDVRLCGAVVETNDDTGLATSIERVQEQIDG